MHDGGSKRIGEGGGADGGMGWRRHRCCRCVEIYKVFFSSSSLAVCFRNSPGRETFGTVRYLFCNLLLFILLSCL